MVVEVEFLSVVLWIVFLFGWYNEQPVLNEMFFESEKLENGSRKNGFNAAVRMEAMHILAERIIFKV